MNNGKVRIYELSKELNLENKDIKDICEQLNIAVKSHSSTITDSQAERVRGAAAKYTPEKTIKRPITNKNKKNNSKDKAKRKQQILAIHHKTDNSEPASPVPQKVSSTSTLTAPPPKDPLDPNLIFHLPLQFNRLCHQQLNFKHRPNPIE